MNDTLITQIKSKLYNNIGRINTAVIRQNWFKESQLCKDIINETNFLSDDICFAARIHCVLNDITVRPICRVTGKNLRWDPCHHKFATISGKENVHLIRNTDWKKLSTSLRAAKKLIKEEFYKKYTNKLYSIVNRDNCIKFIEQRLKDTDCGRLHHFINVKFLQTHVDILCSIADYTNHELLDKDNILWSERFYLLINDAIPPRCCLIPVNKATFISFTKGYGAASSGDNLVKAKLLEMQQGVRDQGFKILNEVTHHQTQEYELECTKCGNRLTRRLTNGRWADIFCAKCNNVNIGSSKPEFEIEQMINEECKIEAKRSYKFDKKKEIDVFVPSQKFGVEYHGLLWHSFGEKYPNTLSIEDTHKNKHYNKYDICKKQGIHLIQIFENEWIRQNAIVRSIIKANLNIFNLKIGSRECKIRTASIEEKKQFLEANHIQGNDNSQHAVALTFNGEIVSMMTISIDEDTNDIQIKRFCSKINTLVYGSESKLLNYIKQNFEWNSINTTVDLRYWTGNLCLKLGFKLKKTIKPSYWYTDTKEVLHRFNFHKQKLINQGADPALTAKETMTKNGWRRIYDCGSLVYTLSAN